MKIFENAMTGVVLLTVTAVVLSLLQGTVGRSVWGEWDREHRRRRAEELNETLACACIFHARSAPERPLVYDFVGIYSPVEQDGANNCVAW